MEGFGPEKILLVLVVVLLLFGAKRIPEIAGSFGKGIREFKKQMNDIGSAPSEPASLPPQRPMTSGTATGTATTPAPDEERAPKRLIP